MLHNIHNLGEKHPSHYICLIHRIRNATVVMLFTISYFRNYILMLFISCVRNIRTYERIGSMYTYTYYIPPKAGRYYTKILYHNIRLCRGRELSSQWWSISTEEIIINTTSEIEKYAENPTYV